MNYRIYGQMFKSTKDYKIQTVKKRGQEKYKDR